MPSPARRHLDTGRAALQAGARRPPMPPCPIPDLTARPAVHGNVTVLPPLPGGHRSAAVPVEDAHGRRCGVRTPRRSWPAPARAAGLRTGTAP